MLALSGRPPRPRPARHAALAAAVLIVVGIGCSRAVGARPAATDRRWDRGDDPGLSAPGPGGDPRLLASGRAGSRSRRAWRCAISSVTRPVPAPRSRRSHSRSVSAPRPSMITSAEEAKEAAEPPNLSDRQIRVHIGPPEFREAIPANGAAAGRRRGRSRRAARRPTRRGGRDPAPEGHRTRRAGLLRPGHRHPPASRRSTPRASGRDLDYARAQLFVATPAVLRYLGIDPGTIEPGTEFLADRSVPGSGLVMPKFTDRGEFALTNVQPIEVGRHLLGAPGWYGRRGSSRSSRPKGLRRLGLGRSRPAGSSSRAGR